jgi:hypothetical protein
VLHGKPIQGRILFRFKQVECQFYLKIKFDNRT